MRRQCVRKNVDLTLVIECVEAFFKERGFKTRKEFSEDENVILWTWPRDRDMRQASKVRIYCSQDDFWMEFTNGERAHGVILRGFATTLFGGGALVLKGLICRRLWKKSKGNFGFILKTK